MKIKNEKVIEVQDWDKLVEKTYGKPYSFQQQDGCQPRGNFYLKVPNPPQDYKNDSVPEIVNGEKMGVSFAAWLKRDCKAPLSGGKTHYGIEPATTEQWQIELWWERNFYPDIQMIANDLHKKGLLEAGEYTINIDW